MLVCFPEESKRRCSRLVAKNRIKSTPPRVSSPPINFPPPPQFARNSTRFRNAELVPIKVAADVDLLTMNEWTRARRQWERMSWIVHNVPLFAPGDNNWRPFFPYTVNLLDRILSRRNCSRRPSFALMGESTSFSARGRTYGASPGHMHLTGMFTCVGRVYTSCVAYLVRGVVRALSCRDVEWSGLDSLIFMAGHCLFGMLECFPMPGALDQSEVLCCG